MEHMEQGKEQERTPLRRWAACLALGAIALGILR
jgi:hypothetical protein